MNKGALILKILEMLKETDELLCDHLDDDITAMMQEVGINEQKARELAANRSRKETLKEILILIEKASM